jgi:hypothetical protein
VIQNPSGVVVPRQVKVGVLSKINGSPYIILKIRRQVEKKRYSFRPLPRPQGVRRGAENGAWITLIPALGQESKLDRLGTIGMLNYLAIPDLSGESFIPPV